MEKLQKGGSSSGLLGWVWRTNYILFERDTSRDGTGPKMVCAEDKEKLTKYYKYYRKRKGISNILYKYYILQNNHESEIVENLDKQSIL